LTEVCIRNVDDWVVDSIRTRARAQGQSLEGTLRALPATQEAMRPKLELAMSFANMRLQLHKKYGAFSDSTAFNREERDRRG